MKLFENSVGRPSNQIKKKRKIFVALAITLVIIVTAILSGTLIFNENTNELRGNTVNEESVGEIKIKSSSGNTIYLNSKNKTTKLSITKNLSNVKWSSSNKKVATVNSKGEVTAKAIGTVTITAKTSDGKIKDTYKIIVKKKNIVVITASLGKRMDCWFSEYNSSNGETYSAQERNCYVKNNKMYEDNKAATDKLGYSENDTLFYIYKSGSSSLFQYEKTYKQYDGGLKIAKDIFTKLYKNKAQRKYVELNVFFTLSGNGVKNNTCDGIISDKKGVYKKYANGYNNVINILKKLGYSSVNGYVLSHAPLNTRQMIGEFPEDSKKNKIVYSTNKNACSKGYRSGYKYALSNRKMEEILNTKDKNGNRKYANLTFVNYSERFVYLDNEEKRTFTWENDENGVSYQKLLKTHDGLHWDMDTTKLVMPIILEEAGL